MAGAAVVNTIIDLKNRSLKTKDTRKTTIGLTALSLRRVQIVLRDYDLDVGLLWPIGAKSIMVCLFDI